MPEEFAVPELCREIRNVREHVVGISQEEAARRMGVSLKAYRAYETFREPKLRRLRQLETSFGLEDGHFLRKAGRVERDESADERARRHDEVMSRMDAIDEAIRQLTVELRQPRPTH